MSRPERNQETAGASSSQPHRSRRNPASGSRRSAPRNPRGNPTQRQDTNENPYNNYYGLDNLPLMGRTDERARREMFDKIYRSMEAERMKVQKFELCKSLERFKVLYTRLHKMREEERRKLDTIQRSLVANKKALLTVWGKIKEKENTIAYLERR